MKCVALVVLMALAAANATFYAPSYVYAPSLGVRSLPSVVPYAYPRAYYRAAAPQVVLSAPAVRFAAPAVQIAAPAPVHTVRVVPQPSVAVAVPNAAVYRAETPGTIHEALLPGHSLSVHAENLELPPGAAPSLE